MALSTQVRTISLPPRWLGESDFEYLIVNAQIQKHLARGERVVIRFPQGSAVPSGVGLCLLSYLNQLAELGFGRLVLEFDDPTGLFGYLGRSGFLDLLSPEIETVPERPSQSAAELWRGRTTGLVEIQPLDPSKPVRDQQGVVGSLVDSLVNYYSNSPQAETLRKQAFIVFGELIDNVFSHSQTSLPGYACLQAYDKRNRPRIQISVSDSGIGIPASIRAGLGARYRAMRDEELVVKAFAEGLSRMGKRSGRGCGLLKCARLAADWGADLSVRVPSALVKLATAKPGQPFHAAESIPSTGQLLGSHVTLQFEVSRLVRG